MKMSKIQSKVISNVKNQERHDLNKTITNASTKMNQMSELPDEDYKAVIVKMLQPSLTNSLDTNEKLRNINQELEFFLKKQMEVRELNSRNKKLAPRYLIIKLLQT